MHVNEKKSRRSATGQTRPAVKTVARAVDALRRGQAVSVKGDARFQMLAVETGVPITFGDDVLTVVPATLDEASLIERIRSIDALVVMKLGRNLPKVRRALQATGLADRAVYVERGTMAGEKVKPLTEKTDDEAPYFSMILVHGRGRRP